MFGVIAVVEVSQQVLDGGRLGKLGIAGVENSRCSVGLFVDQMNNAMTDRHQSASCMGSIKKICTEQTDGSVAF